MTTLMINEIYHSIQGESSFVGLPCVFIRTMGCSLRCSYCDTEYAFYDGQEKEINWILKEVQKFKTKLFLLTGGEPLDQSNSLILLTLLCDQGYTACIETGGHLDISSIDERVHIILDVKTPSSKMDKKNHYKNLDIITKKDEVKFVVGNEDDLNWSLNIIEQYKLENKTNILISPVFGEVDYQWLAQRIIESNKKIRLQIQQHKIIWGPKKKSV
ncbi:MAG: 7-carboxy-7-deazaguanine synthase [Planctomycetota bacterium]|nr:MAG: 7-carboxy-7-deazaguanine synthase [Planctomycetota bacterium]